MNDAQAQTSNQGYEEKELDLAEGVLPSGRTVLTSLTARVGSISDNNKGGYVMPIPFYRLLLRCGFFTYSDGIHTGREFRHLPFLFVMGETQAHFVMITDLKRPPIKLYGF